jgi:hypothetical protein
MVHGGMHMVQHQTGLHHVIEMMRLMQNGNPNGLRAISIYDEPTSNWGQLEGCYGDRDSISVIKEELEAFFVNFNFETVTEKGQELRAQFGIRYEEEDRTSSLIQQFLQILYGV